MRAALFAAAATSLVLSACAVEEPAPAGQTPESSSAKQTTDAAATPAPGSGEKSQQPAGEKKVDIVNFVFERGELTVPAGTTVTWTQQDSSLHTVDFEDGEKSGEMAQGDTYSRTFDEPGEYPYICFYHPRMTGTVTVT